MDRSIRQTVKVDAAQITYEINVVGTPGSDLEIVMRQMRALPDGDPSKHRLAAFLLWKASVMESETATYLQEVQDKFDAAATRRHQYRPVQTTHLPT